MSVDSGIFMVGNKKLIDITMEFPNSACDIKNLNAIGNGKKDLIKLLMKQDLQTVDHWKIMHNS